MNPKAFVGLSSDPTTISLTIGSASGSREEGLATILSGKNLFLDAIQHFQTLMSTYSFSKGYYTSNQQLSSSRQYDSIEDYITKFNCLALAYNTGEFTLMNFPINGLNENRRVHVSIMRDCFLQQHLPVSLDWVYISATCIAATKQPVMHGQSSFKKHHKKCYSYKLWYGARVSIRLTDFQKLTTVTVSTNHT